jgi:hypothetical protein
MKKLITTSILVLFLVCGLKAQTIEDLPTFTGKDLVLRSEETSSFHTITISDGNGDVFTVGIHRSDSHPTKSLANLFGKIKKQAF